MEHILDLNKQSEQLIPIFQKITERNTILFLGAGASLGEKRYLSKEIIQYYEAYLGKNYGEPNIVKFLDILSADVNFDRRHFDNEVVKMLQKLDLTQGHLTLASIPWREIITTNYDLLVERAYDELYRTSQSFYELKPLRNSRQYNYRESNTEIKYIKLNGCISDCGAYPLAFSSDDFQRLKPFYKTALNNLRNLSPNISFLAIGYSFSDDFGKELLEKFDSYNYRDRKWIINVDPFPNNNALPFYTSKKICIVRSSFQDFFNKYKEWEERNHAEIIRRKGLIITNSRGNQIGTSKKLLINLDGIVKQLNNQTHDRFIKDSEFYKGEEPNFSVITRGVDVVKSKLIEQSRSKIESSLSDGNSTFLPIFFVTGDFGIGKSTFTLRLIYELEKIAELDLIAFEIVDFQRVQKEFLISLVNSCSSKNIVFFCDEVEIESNFKILLEIQRDLSIEQFHDFNVYFIVPIRSNILERYKLQRTIPRSYELNISGQFEDDEVDDLLEKLKSAGLIDFRDARDKNRIKDKIRKEFGRDSFISLMNIVTSGNHVKDLISAYNQLSADTQRAFLYTALIHKHKLMMPATWLKQNIEMDWDEFTEKVIKAEGKGLLIQELVESNGTQPDLFFRTKHPLIAEKLVETFIANKDKQFAFYDKMLRTINEGQSNCYLVNNLLKTFVKSGEYSDTQINRLHDAAYTKLSDDPYYILNYSINLQSRHTKADAKKAIGLLIYADSLLEKRNHKFIHRRGVINFELAKMYYGEEEILNLTLIYINEAEELFIIKQLDDPCSSYSYVDYIKMLIWQLNNIELEKEDELQKRILIEELFDTANRTVSVGIEKINALHTEYATYIENTSNNQDYIIFLEELYADTTLRPYACILKYNYFLSINDSDNCQIMIEEMENYMDNFEVVKFLFKFYGRNLFDPNVRIKLQRVSRDNSTLEKDSPLRYSYFNFIAESYNYNFQEGRNHLSNIQAKFFNLNPEFHNVWRDSDGEEKLFDAQIIKRPGEKYRAVKIPQIQQTIRLIKGNYEDIPLGSTLKVKLHFYLYGLMAEIIRND